MNKITLLSNTNEKIIKFLDEFKNDNNFYVSSIFIPDNEEILFKNYNNLKIIKHSDLEILNQKIFKNFNIIDELYLKKYDSCKKSFFKMLEFHTYDKIVYSTEEKNQLFKKTLNFILNFLKEENPSIIINLHIPHDYFEVLLCEVCEINRIKHIFLRHFGIPNIYTVQLKLYSNNLINDYYINNREFKKNIENVYQTIIDNSKHLQEVIKLKKKVNIWQNNSLIFLNISDKISNIIFFIERILILFKENLKVVVKIILNFIKLKNLSLLNEIYFSKEKLKVKNKKLYEHKNSNFFFNYINFKSDLKKFKLMKNYKKVSKNPNLEDNFIYFPTWYQPSASTYPFANKFIDNFEVIKLLSKNNYDLKIYTKEHEDIFNLSRHAWIKGSYSRDLNFYEEMNKLENLFFVNFDVPDSELIDKSIAVATQPSKNSLISIFRDKPVLMFGNSLINGLDGVFEIDNKQDLNIALSKILSGFKINNEKKVKFFNILSQFSFLTDEMNSFNKVNNKTSYKDLFFILKKIIYLKEEF